LAGLATVFVAIPAYRIAIKATPGEAANQGAPVTVVSPERRDISDILSYSGLLKPEATITIMPKIPGRVVSLLVLESSYVRKDDLLAVIDDEVVSLQAKQAKAGYDAAKAQADKSQRSVRPQELENAQASLRQAEADLAAAEAKFGRTRQLYEAGTVAKSTYEEAGNAMRSARTQLENARRSVSLMEEGASQEDQLMASSNAEAMKAQYDLALLQAENSKVRAPASGRVVKILVEAGNMVSPTMPLVVIAQDTSMTAQVAVPERLYGRFLSHRGPIRATVKPIAFDGRQAFDGVVASLSQAVDSQSRSFLVEVSVDNSRRLLRSGMFVDVALYLETAAGVIAVPEASIVRKGEQTFVFTVVPPDPPLPGQGLASRVAVKTGLAAGGFVEISAGLRGGELVVLEGNAFLDDGQHVRIVDGK
jgi:RND family efflux transporter MFP subunit